MYNMIEVMKQIVRAVTQKCTLKSPSNKNVEKYNEFSNCRV